MSKLKQALKSHGVDADPLGVLFGSGRETVLGLVSGGESAVDIWRRLRVAAGEIGYWPVILGGDEDLRRLRQNFAAAPVDGPGSGASEIIAAGNRVGVTNWLTERAAGLDMSRSPAPGAWPTGDVATHHFTLPIDPDHGTPLPRVHIALAPTVLGWQAPAFMRFGRWGNCPAPEHHVAMLKYWRQKYGAELVGVGGASLELAVSRPPEDRREALRLAREQSVYCPAVVSSAAGSLEQRAATLHRATAWLLWWE